MADQVASVFHALIDNVESIVRGKAESIRLALCCLLTEGHLLIDDVPGTGKTSMAKAIAGSIAGSWKRVQFTPDLLPSDVTGVMVFDQRTSSFSFRQGPVFTNVLIGDEINRASPKTQSALLEVMEERQVTADGVPHLVPRPFFVIATQNPRDFHGTFPLPDVQLDRFAMKLSLGYADQATEVTVLESYRRENRDRGVPAVTNATQLEQLIASIEQIEVVHSINDYIVRLANATRAHPDLRLGVSTRGTLSLDARRQGLRGLRAAWLRDAGRHQDADRAGVRSPHLVELRGRTAWRAQRAGLGRDRRRHRSTPTPRGMTTC